MEKHRSCELLFCWRFEMHVLLYFNKWLHKVWLSVTATELGNSLKPAVVIITLFPATRTTSFILPSLIFILWCYFFIRTVWFCAWVFITFVIGYLATLYTRKSSVFFLKPKAVERKWLLFRLVLFLPRHLLTWLLRHMRRMKACRTDPVCVSSLLK